MHFSDFVPLGSGFAKELAVMSKMDWFAAEQDPDNPNGFRVLTEKIKSGRLAVPRWFKGLDGRAMIYLNSLCELLRNGFKVFRPNAEQCEAMEHVELPIYVRDVRVPFPAFAIDFPKEYKESLKVRGLVTPKALMIQQGELVDGKPYLVVGGGYDDPALAASTIWKQAEYFYVMHDNHETVEEKLQRYLNQDQTEIPREEAKEPGHQTNELLSRLAINLALMATHFGISRPVEANPAYAQKLRRQCPTSQAARLELKSMAKYFELAQHTVIRKIQAPSAEHGGTHASPRPHHRRGHWRSKPGYAQQRREGKEVPLIFIHPVFVRAEAFLGELSATRADYQM
jgi:hypothetical protein